MVKKLSNSSRFKSAKAPVASKAPAKTPEGEEKPKRHFRPSVKAKRREKFYSVGKGSTGVLVSRPRVARVIRNARKIQTIRYQQITGIEPSGKRPSLSKGFVQVAVGALDAYANRLMEIAAELAQGRRTLRMQDINRAHEVIQKITHQ